MYEQERLEAKKVVNEFLEKAKLKRGDLIVVGCSTSEIASKRIGTYSSAELGEAVFLAMYEEFNKADIYIAAQCCEHLNRALIMEREAAQHFCYDEVNVVPQPKAGGSFATAAYKYFEEPVAVEAIQAKGGIDIGDTLIGMHLKSVAVPIRLEQTVIGGAHIVCARTRAKYIGGERAHYNEELA